MSPMVSLPPGFERQVAQTPAMVVEQQVKPGSPLPEQVIWQRRPMPPERAPFYRP